MSLKYLQIQISLLLKTSWNPSRAQAIPSEWPFLIFSSKSEWGLRGTQCGVPNLFLNESKQKSYFDLLHNFGFSTAEFIAQGFREWL